MQSNTAAFLMLTFWLAMAPALSAQTGEVNSCVSCHLEEGEELAVPVEGMRNDVHAQNGLSCADCHGGDPKAGLDGDMDAAMDPDKGYIGVPSRKDIPTFCARCHSNTAYMRKFNPRVASNQLERYKTSIHGKRLINGDEKVATCVDCHGVHGIRASNDALSLIYPTNVPSTCGRCHADAEYMADYDIPINQLTSYTKSVHGVALLDRGDLGAPACNDCHGNHGAAPPGAPSIAFICGQCHLNNSELFFKSPHRVAYEENDFPECETCHDYHDIQHPSDEMLGVGENSICIECHEEDSKGYATAIAMRNQIEFLKSKMSTADSLVALAERAGMEVSDALYQLNDADDALVKARTQIHSLDLDNIVNVTNEGVTLADAALLAGTNALSEVQFRRKGLAVSLVFLLILAVGLYLKIKEIDIKHPLR